MTTQGSPPAWPAGDPLFYEIWEASPDAKVLSDESGIVVLANPAYFKLHAYSLEAILGQDLAIVFPEPEREQARMSYRAIFEAGRPIEGIESSIRCGDGSVKTVQIRVSFIVREGRRYMLWVIRDISEFKLVERAIADLNRSLEDRVAERTAQLAETVQELLQEVSARAEVQSVLQSVLRLQQAILDSASYAIIAAGLDGTILSFNPAAEHMLGYRAAEMIGRMSLVGFFDPDELRARSEDPARAHGLDLLRGIMHPGLAGDQPPADEWSLRRADGTALPVTVSLTILRDDNGQPEGFLAIVADISQRRAVEEALRQANTDMARAARLKDEFLANMSHELRTPLNTILGRAEALQEQFYGPLNERQLHSIHSIEESGRDLLTLINDILDIAKIEAGRLELQLEPCNLAELCRSSVSIVAEAAQQKRIEVGLRLDDTAMCIVADQRRLKQILSNLLSNAVKFTPAGGRIGCETRADPAARELSITVWDTGIGIAPEDQARLFQPFVQIDSSLSRQYAGTGLGLSLVDRLARLHGGRVELASAPGQGSRFSVVIPWRAGPPIPPEPPADLGLAGSDDGTVAEPALVLLVEDHDENIALVREYLEALGYRVAVARSGGEALQLAAALDPAVVVMDIQIPGLDGLEAIRCLRAAPATAWLPIIALTGLAMVGDCERCLAAGASEYLSKPVSLKQLGALIGRYARGGLRAIGGQ